MTDEIKSLIAGTLLVFIYLVVLQGDIPRRGVTFCHNFVDVPVLRSVPCFALNLVIGCGTLLLFGLVVAGVRRLGE